MSVHQQNIGMSASSCNTTCGRVEVTPDSISVNHTEQDSVPDSVGATPDDQDPTSEAEVRENSERFSPQSSAQSEGSRLSQVTSQITPLQDTTADAIPKIITEKEGREVIRRNTTEDLLVTMKVDEVVGTVMFRGEVELYGGSTPLEELNSPVPPASRTVISNQSTAASSEKDSLVGTKGGVG